MCCGLVLLHIIGVQCGGEFGIENVSWAWIRKSVPFNMLAFRDVLLADFCRVPGGTILGGLRDACFSW